MMRFERLTSLFASACAVLAIAVQVACSPPWTVRSISGASDARFDPVAYVDDIWDQKVVPEAMRSAVDLRSALEAVSLAGASSGQQARSAFVTGTAVVTGVDHRSRVGLAGLDLIPADGRPDASLQIGPVIRGTAARDALPFVRFTDFANQIDFAGVASELNQRVISKVLTGIDIDSLDGKTIVFHAAMTSTTVGSARPELVPIALRIEEATR